MITKQDAIYTLLGWHSFIKTKLPEEEELAAQVTSNSSRVRSGVITPIEGLLTSMFQVQLTILEKAVRK